LSGQPKQTKEVIRANFKSNQLGQQTLSGGCDTMAPRIFEIDHHFVEGGKARIFFVL
jgi:hypothetical protein